MANRNGGFIGTDGLDAPDPPTAVTPTAGDAQVSVAFTAPTDTGTSAITGFVAQVSTDGTDYSAGSNTGTSSPIVVSSLTNDTAATAKVWAINAYGTSAPSVASASFTPAVPVLALRFGGGISGNDATNVIDKIDITTLGDAVDYGDLTDGSTGNAGLGSSTRAVCFIGFNNTAYKNTICFKLFSSSGNMSDFGDLTESTTKFCAASNATRGLRFGGDSSVTVDYITIANEGNATDFGDLSSGGSEAKNQSACASPTRAIVFGGNLDSPGFTNQIGYFTIGSTGNQNDFGDLLAAVRDTAAFASSTRGVCGGGHPSGGTFQDVIQYITISSTGNATDFGDMVGTGKKQHAGASSNTRGLFMGGQKSGETYSNEIEYITIASTGDAADFGDLTVTVTGGQGAASNAHGGLA